MLLGMVQLGTPTTLPILEPECLTKELGKGHLFGRNFRKKCATLRKLCAGWMRITKTYSAGLPDQTAKSLEIGSNILSHLLGADWDRFCEILRCLDCGRITPNLL